MSPKTLILLGIAAALLAELSFHIRPADYFGGSSDEQRYLEVALRWIARGPQPGNTHWGLRHPLIVSIVASFKAFGVSIESLQLAPRLYGDLLFGITVPMLARHAGLRAALLWLPIALVMPVLHRNITNCGPEILELTFGVISLWAFWEARGGSRRSGVLMIASGLALGMAVITRETAACLLLPYGYAWARGYVPRRLALWFVAGLVPPIAFDVIWLWSVTGNPLYRLQVDQSHIGIYSAHLRGGVYHGRPYLNPDLASRWLPNGPIKLNWAIDPVLNFFAETQFGLIFAGWAALWGTAAIRRAQTAPARRALPWLLALTLASYVFVTWVLTLRPQPRYYLFAVYAATIAVALLATTPGDGGWPRRIKRLAVFCMLVCGTLTCLLSPDRQRDPRLIIPWLQRHPDRVLHLPTEDAARLGFPAILAGVLPQISGDPPRVGDLRVRVITAPPGSGSWRYVTTLQGPWLFPYINQPRRLVIEQRVR